MRRLHYFLLIALLPAIVGCRRSQADIYQRYLEEKTDSSFEYVTQPVDSLAGEEQTDADTTGLDDDGLVAIPDIPKDRSVNMNADSYEVDKMMQGGDYDY